MKLLLRYFLALLLGLSFSAISKAATIHKRAQETLTAVEIDQGDTLLFTLRNGKLLTFILRNSEVKLIYTSLENTKKGVPQNLSLYAMNCVLDADGQPMTMQRFVPVQESFYEPYVVNGVRIWFDGLKEAGNFFIENHGECLPKKAARFALQDATLPICPERIQPWYPNDANYIDSEFNYNGDDAWMGPYFGADLHGGLDINMPIGTTLWAPISVDEQFFFASLKAGDNNNRWRAFRTWPNGDKWTFQTHHLVNLLVPEHTPLKAGQPYAITAGTYYGTHPHTHFNFKVDHGQGDILLDPWILFWQIFENNKEDARSIKANIAPLTPEKAGAEIQFRSAGSRKGPGGNKLQHYWTFGDGGFSTEANPKYTFTRTGVFAVTLLVEDGVNIASFTQHITIAPGRPNDKSKLILKSKESSFLARYQSQLDVYNKHHNNIPHTLTFTARPKGNFAPATKELAVVNMGSGTLGPVTIEVIYEQGENWVHVVPQGEGNKQMLAVSANAQKLPTGNGFYNALIRVSNGADPNDFQMFRAALNVPKSVPDSVVIVDEKDPACTYTPWFWLSPKSDFNWTKGHKGAYLINGLLDPNRPAFVRFAPDLQSGQYRVKLLSPSLPRMPASNGFYVLVHSAQGNQKIWMDPQKSLEIGKFNFNEGTEGYVEITTLDAKGLIVVDAMSFEKIK